MYKIFNDSIVVIPPEEVAEINRAVAEAATQPMSLDEVARIVVASALNGIEADDITALRMAEFYPSWEAGKTYPAEHKVQHNGILYRCLTAHTAQEGWTPEAAPSLWAQVLIPDPDIIPDWQQPDSTNAYHAGDKVRYDGKVWQSDIDGNVWTPGEYGWTEVVI